LHTTGLQAALTHTSPLAAQSSVTDDVRPSAEQVVTCSPVAAQAVVDGWQTQGAHAGAALVVIEQERPEPQLAGAPQVLPIVSQVLMPPPMQRALPGSHTSGAQAPALQKEPVGQSLLVTHITQTPPVLSHSMPSGVHARSDMQRRRQWPPRH